MALALAVSASSICGCATVGARLIADNDEYLAYRRVRTSVRVDKRLAASAAYLAAHPQGQWEPVVRPWFDRAELRYWHRIKETPAGLATYLETLPEGPHAHAAKEALAAYDEQRRSSSKELLDLKAAMTEGRLAGIAQQREEVLSTFAGWLGRLLAIETWGQRTSQLDHETIFAWRLDPPRGSCVDNRCTKLIQREYELPGGGERAERRLVMDVILELDSGMLRQATLSGPNLFSRLYEAGMKKPVLHDAPAARVEAIAYAVEVVRGATEARLPSNRCAGEAVAPVVLLRTCDGWTVKVVAAETPEDDDLVSISGPYPASTSTHHPAPARVVTPNR